MVGESFFLTVSQLGLGFAGLAGLIGLFKKTQGDLDPQDLQGLRLMLEHALAAILLSLLPFAFAFSPRLNGEYIHTPVLALISFCVLDLFNNARRWHRGKQREAPPRFPKVFIWFFFVPQSAVIVGLICWGLPRLSLASYAAGLVWLLFPCAAQMLCFARTAEKKIIEEFKG
jgi:hypothetical protein